jgi:hypothetical protein
MEKNTVVLSGSLAGVSQRRIGQDRVLSTSCAWTTMTVCQ